MHGAFALASLNRSLTLDGPTPTGKGGSRSALNELVVQVDVLDVTVNVSILGWIDRYYVHIYIYVCGYTYV